jgi:hypothetical protein
MLIIFAGSSWTHLFWQQAHKSDGDNSREDWILCSTILLEYEFDLKKCLCFFSYPPTQITLGENLTTSQQQQLIIETFRFKS